MGRSFSYTFPTNTFSDADGTTLTYTASRHISSSVIQALPTWLSFNASTRTFSGTPGSTDVDTVVVRVTATDTSAESVSDEFEIRVRNPIEITGISDKSIVLGSSALAVPVTISHSVFSDLEYRFTSSDKTVATVSPTGWHEQDDEGLQITPVAVGSTTITVAVRDDDGDYTASTSFTVTVTSTANSAPTVATEIPDQAATVGTAFSFTLPTGTSVTRTVVTASPTWPCRRTGRRTPRSPPG